MTLKEFDRLDEAEQIEAVWKSIRLADFVESPYRYVLYQMNEFLLSFDTIRKATHSQESAPLMIQQNWDLTKSSLNNSKGMVSPGAP